MTISKAWSQERSILEKLLDEAKETHQLIAPSKIYLSCKIFIIAKPSHFRTTSEVELLAILSELNNDHCRKMIDTLLQYV